MYLWMLRIDASFLSVIYLDFGPDYCCISLNTNNWNKTNVKHLALNQIQSAVTSRNSATSSPKCIYLSVFIYLFDFMILKTNSRCFRRKMTFYMRYELQFYIVHPEWPKGAPHTYSFTLSFNCTANNCAVRSRVYWKFRTIVQLKFLDCVTFETAEDLTSQLTLDCSVCCVLKAEAHFFYIFNAVNIT
jgi:hypothetical protein